MQRESDNFYHGLNNLQAEFFRPVPGSQKFLTLGSVISFFVASAQSWTFLIWIRHSKVFLFVFDSTSHKQKMLSSMEGTVCHSNKKTLLLYVGMLAPKDVLQFSGTSCALEGMTLKLGAPGEHAFPRHTYYINLQVSSYLVNNYWKSSKISSNPLLMSPTFQYFFSTSFLSLQNWQ
jgi:hypothetical protein